MGKKKDKKHAGEQVDLEAEVKRLRKENHDLKKRLKKIAALTEDIEVSEVEGDDTGGDEELDDIPAGEEASPVPVA